MFFIEIKKNFKKIVSVRLFANNNTPEDLFSLFTQTSPITFNDDSSGRLFQDARSLNSIFLDETAQSPPC